MTQDPIQAELNLEARWHARDRRYAINYQRVVDDSMIASVRWYRMIEATQIGSDDLARVARTWDLPPFTPR